MPTQKRVPTAAPTVHTIQKRDGSVVPFDIVKITHAINKAMLASEEGSLKEAEIVATKVYADVLRISKKYKNFIPTV